MRRAAYVPIVFLLMMINLSTAFSEEKWEKWTVLDIPFRMETASDTPFDVIFGAKFRHTDGHELDIPGFYNDDNIWLIRFCPALEGEWQYETYSTEPELAGQTGTISVTANTRAVEHGPVQISRENPRRFRYADGTPYFLMAFEIDWLFALDWDNPHDIPKTRKIVSHIKDNGFNQVIMNVYAYDAGWGEKDKIKPEHNYAKPAVFPFGGSNEQPDFSTLNIDFFKHLDRVISHLDQEEIIAHLMIYVWNKKVNWPEPDSKADNLYFDYVVKRYQAFPNLIWDISKEALAYGRDDMSYITRRIDRLRKQDGHDRLVSVHDYSYCAKFPEKVDFISIQEWRPNLYSTMLEVAGKHPDKPVFNIEHGGYEQTVHQIFGGAYSDPLTCLERNYQCVFAGTYSTYYWQNTAWYEVFYDPFTLPEENQPNFHWYGNLVSFFETYKFDRLKPFQESFTPYCLTDHETVYLFFIPENMTRLTGSVPELSGKTVKIKWFDPLSNQLYESGEKSFDHGTWLGIGMDERITAPFCVVLLEVR